MVIMSKLNFFIGLILGAIGGWLGDMFFGRTTLENQISALRSERIVVQGQLKDAERVMAAQSAEITDLKDALELKASKPTKTITKPAPTKKATKTSRADDLRLIEGIGPKASSILIDAGVSTFAEMASMSSDELTTILKAAKLRGKFYTDSWPEQAAIAATGDLDALTKMQNELVGGRRVS